MNKGTKLASHITQIDVVKRNTVDKASVVASVVEEQTDNVQQVSFASESLEYMVIELKETLSKFKI